MLLIEKIAVSKFLIKREILLLNGRILTGPVAYISIKIIMFMSLNWEKE